MEFTIQQMNNKCLRQFLKEIMKSNYKFRRKLEVSEFGIITNPKYKVQNKLIGFSCILMINLIGKVLLKKDPIIKYMNIQQKQ
jgi:hypothetical protein